MIEPSSGQEANLPFQKNLHYRVIKDWYRNGTTFEIGQELAYEDSIYNHYDDVRIFCFKDLKQGYPLGWPCSMCKLDTRKEYFEKMETKKLES